MDLSSVTVGLKLREGGSKIPCRWLSQSEIYSVHGAFFSTTRFSFEAMDAAKQLNIKLERYPFPRRFPIIKCKKGNEGENYYYLPTDWQYDMVKLNLKEGDCYCSTVEEAEAAGFRRPGKVDEGERP